MTSSFNHEITAKGLSYPGLTVFVFSCGLMEIKI